MAQFDAYPNPNPRLRETVPYLVVLQSDRLDRLDTRLVAPLVGSAVAPPGLPHRLCPRFAVERDERTLLPREAAPVLAKLLRRPVSTLRAESHRIVNALDAVVSGI